MSISKRVLQFGLINASIPIICPGKVNAYNTMIAIMTNNAGIKTLATFPIPSLRSLCEINHKIIQIKIVAIAVGIRNVHALARLELPPTKSEK